MKPRAMIRAAALCAAVVSGARTARAHTRPVAAEELTRAAGAIMVGVVEGTRVSWSEDRSMIFTDYDVRVEDSIKGGTESVLHLRTPGGSIDGLTVDSCLTLRLSPGQRYLFFLAPSKDAAHAIVLAADQGAVREIVDPGSGESRAMPLSGRFWQGWEGGRTRFDDVVARIRELAAASTRDALPPAAADSGTVGFVLPAKEYLDASSAAFGDPDAAPPGAAGAAQGAAEPMELAQPLVPGEEPEAPGPVPHETLTAAVAEDGPVRTIPAEGAEYRVLRRPPRFVVYNQLPASFAPWSPHDQYMMSSWNARGDIFRVLATARGTWAWRDYSYDIAGWVPDATMARVFGSGWDPFVLAVTYSWWTGSGPVIESDIALNPAYSWTTDTEIGTRDSSNVWGFDQTILHELGHSWGLQHPWESQDVWWDSVMNYSPKDYRLPSLTTDDANAIRAAYPGVSLHDAHLYAYCTVDSLFSMNAFYQGVDPDPPSVPQGAALGIRGNLMADNGGTDDIVDPTVQVFLTPERLSFASSSYLGTWTYTTTLQPFGSTYLRGGQVSVPDRQPPGKYYIAFHLPQRGDADLSNNTGWTRENVRVEVLSHQWMLFPSDEWQTDSAGIGPEGTFLYAFTPTRETEYDFSLCEERGGAASFDTVLTIRDFAGIARAASDDACGFGSEIASFRPADLSPYTVALHGYGASSRGSYDLVYRRRTVPDPASSLAAKRVSKTRFRLKWVDASMVESRYEILRRDDGSDAVLLTLPANTRKAVVKGLARSSTYVLGVRACAADACSSVTEVTVETR